MKLADRKLFEVLGEAAVAVQRYREAEAAHEAARRREVEADTALAKATEDDRREELFALRSEARREKEAARSILRGFESPGPVIAILEEVLARADRLQQATMALRDAAPGRTKPSKKYDAALAQVDEVLNGPHVEPPA